MQVHSHQANQSQLAWWLLKLLVLLFGRGLFVVLSSQPYCYICIHSRSALRVQNSGIALPTKHPTAATLWLSAKKTALTKSLVVPVSLCSWDNGIFKIWGVGRQFTCFLNIMAGLGFGIASSETCFKVELCFFLQELVCLQILSLYQQARSSANMCLSVVKGHPYTKVTIWLVNHSPQDQKRTSLAAFFRAPRHLPLDWVTTLSCCNVITHLCAFQ